MILSIKLGHNRHILAEARFADAKYDFALKRISGEVELVKRGTDDIPPQRMRVGEPPMAAFSQYMSFYPEEGIEVDVVYVCTNKGSFVTDCRVDVVNDQGVLVKSFMP